MLYENWYLAIYSWYLPIYLYINFFSSILVLLIVSILHTIGIQIPKLLLIKKSNTSLILFLESLREEDLISSEGEF